MIIIDAMLPGGPIQTYTYQTREAAEFAFEQWKALGAVYVCMTSNGAQIAVWRVPHD